MKKQEIYLSSFKQLPKHIPQTPLEFKNGSRILGVDLAKGNDFSIVDGKAVENTACKNSRGNRAEIVWYDDSGYGNKKWYHKFLLNLEFAIEDIKDFTRRKYHSVIKLGRKIKNKIKR